MNSTADCSEATDRPLAVVTGASSGIGLELAKEFARRGYDLFLCSGTSDLSQSVAQVEQLDAVVRGTATADLRTYDGVQTVFEAIEELGQPIEAAALNAGVGIGGRFVSETDLDAELDLIALNVVSTVHLAKLISQQMAEAGRGELLFTGSIAGTMPTPFEAVYGASKAFVNSFGQSLRNELAGTGVNVTVLEPGATETNFFHRAGMDSTEVGAGKKDDPADVAKDGVNALLRHDDKIVAGSMKTKAQGVMSDILPDSVKARLHHKKAEPGSAQVSSAEVKG